LVAGVDDEMFMTKSLGVTPKTTEHRLIVLSDRFVAYVTKKTDRRFILGLLKLTTDRYKASHGLFATAELLVLVTSSKRYYSLKTFTNYNDNRRT